MKWEQLQAARLCEHSWETGTIYGNGYEGMRHYERRCALCGAFQEISDGEIVAGW